MNSTKSYDYKKNTISRLFAIQALFQMEANGKSYSIIKRELKEKFYMHQIQDAEFLKDYFASTGSRRQDSIKELCYAELSQDGFLPDSHAIHESVSGERPAYAHHHHHHHKHREGESVEHIRHEETPE